MLLAQLLPKLTADAIATLARLDGNYFPVLLSEMIAPNVFVFSLLPGHVVLSFVTS